MRNLNPEPKVKELPQELYQEFDAFLDTLEIDEQDERRRGALIQSLHKAQEIFGFLPEEIQIHIANKFSIHHAEVSGVVSFYNYFTTKPKGKYKINVCMGTACYVKGADKVLHEFERALDIKAGEVTEDMKFSVEGLRCVGACGLAPVVMVNEKVSGKVHPDDVGQILEEYLVETETETKTTEV